MSPKIDGDKSYDAGKRIAEKMEIDGVGVEIARTIITFAQVDSNFISCD